MTLTCSQIHTFGGQLEVLLSLFPQGLSFPLAKSISHDILWVLRDLHDERRSLGGNEIGADDILLIPNLNGRLPFTISFRGFNPNLLGGEFSLFTDSILENHIVSSLPDDLSFENCKADDIFHFGIMFFKMLHNKGKVESAVDTRSSDPI